MAAQSQGNQGGGSAFNVETEHKPDASYANALLNGGAIQSVENQMAGPRATFKSYDPPGKTKAISPSLGKAPNVNSRWK